MRSSSYRDSGCCRWLEPGLRILLGLVLTVSGVMKLEDPLAFRRVMDTFGFLPWLAISIAVVLPMFEFFCGVLLVLKVRSRAMVTAIGWLLLGFSIFVGWAALSGKWTECGCFGRLWLVGESPMAALGRNSFLLAVAWLVYRWQDE